MQKLGVSRQADLFEFKADLHSETLSKKKKKQQAPQSLFKNPKQA